MFDVTWENCKNCEYCEYEGGQSDWYCRATDEQYIESDSLPCKQEEINESNN